MRSSFREENRRCEETCPQKAIRFEEIKVPGMKGKLAKLKKPYVVDELCNGCGICEYVCPVEGKSGIRITAVKDRIPLGSGEFPESGNQADPYR